MGTREFQWFWAQVDKSAGPNACWAWQGDILATGYGRTFIKRIGSGAHRLALILSCGEPPDDKPCACHSCDNRACCNPQHLRWGSHQDNADDKISRGRARTTARKFDRVELVRLRHEGWSYSMLATHFGVCQSNIGRALRRLGFSGGVAPNGAAMKKQLEEAALAREGE